MSQEPKVTHTSDVSGNAEGVPQSAGPSASSLYVYKPGSWSAAGDGFVYLSAKIALDAVSDEDLDVWGVMGKLSKIKSLLKDFNKNAPKGWVENHPGVKLLVRRLYEMTADYKPTSVKLLVRRLYEMTTDYKPTGEDLEALFDCQNLVAGLEVVAERK